MQLDTREVRPARGVVLKHFSARDMVSRWDVLEVHERATLPSVTNHVDEYSDVPFANGLC